MVKQKSIWPPEAEIQPTMAKPESALEISQAIAIQDAVDVLKSLDLAELYAKKFTKEAVDTILSLMRDDEIKADVRLKAAMAILSRAWGNPAIAIRATTDSADREKRKSVEEAILEAQKAAGILMERAKKGFQIPYSEINIQEGE